MLSSKKNVLETIALLKAYGINQVVISPGSRNSPLIHTFTQHPFFSTHLVLDERNAAFFAIGIILKTQKPVAVCCTSGTALLNFAPAVAEAFYANLPLIVISADRAPEWIGQMDGQTIPQQHALREIVKKNVQIPEIDTNLDLWFANRLLNEALIAATAGEPGPVHINLPISEPLFDFSVKELPVVRKIAFIQGEKLVCNSHLKDVFVGSKRKMIVVGQQFSSLAINTALQQLATQKSCVVLAENLSNLHFSELIGNFDTIMASQNDEDFAPDLLITFGGHVVSKRLKHFLRKHQPQHHWHIATNTTPVDLFQSLTDWVEADSLLFLKYLLSVEGASSDAQFFNQWQSISKQVSEPSSDLPFSDITVTGQFLRKLPQASAVHLANSSVVRNAQLFAVDPSISIFCNRGTNGIESSLPTAIGYASVNRGLTFLVIGDLSFFYTVGALWNLKNLKNLRILIINNGGGSIFHLLPGMNKSEALTDYIAAGHQTSARLWIEAAGVHYLSAHNESEYTSILPDFVSSDSENSLVLEVFTNIEANKSASEMYLTKRK